MFFSTNSLSPPPLSHLKGLSHYITLFRRSSLPFIDRSVHHLSACPIRHLPKPFVSCGSQGSIVLRSSQHKCSQDVWWDALNVGAATTSSVMSGLTPIRSFFSVVRPPLVMCHWHGPNVRVCGLLGLAMDSSAMDMTRGAVALLPHNNP